jgi:glycosyltransferase involved in cell wall biosynthesis
VQVLTLGWEFPPFFTGGVGVVCEALTRALARRGVEIIYLMPRGPEQATASHLRLLVAGSEPVELRALPSWLAPYAVGGGPGPWAAQHPGEPGSLYGPDLLDAVARFAARAAALVRERGLRFDLIHAHDWTCFEAGIALREETGRPLIVHVHITEFDKSGGAHADPRVFALEQRGLRAADLVLAVSERVARRCIESYGTEPARVRVVHNAVERDPAPRSMRPPARDRIVLFLGRITLQKGPDWFLEAARRVLDLEPDTTFVLAGTGDMWPRLVERAAELGIAHKVLFPGFVDREQASALYSIADVFVMPSVSEPFGLVPLEAMDRGVPTIVSRQSGVAEVVRHALKVDFWDVGELANKILAALRYPALREELSDRGQEEVERLNWDAVAARVHDLYRRLLEGPPLA